MSWILANENEHSNIRSSGNFEAEWISNTAESSMSHTVETWSHREGGRGWFRSNSKLDSTRRGTRLRHSWEIDGNEKIEFGLEEGKKFHEIQKQLTFTDYFFESKNTESKVSIQEKKDLSMYTAEAKISWWWLQSQSMSKREENPWKIISKL